MRIAPSVNLRFVRFIAVPLTAFACVCCSSPPETTKPPAVTIRPTKQSFVPEGWTALQRAQKSSAGEMRLTKNDASAFMVVRELKPLASARDLLVGEDVCMLGNISMGRKIGEGRNGRRILRPPSSVGNGKPYCVYMYSENSLLRRVVVFRTRSAILEVELLQESPTLAFSSVIEAQTALAKSLMNGGE